MSMAHFAYFSSVGIPLMKQFQLFPWSLSGATTDKAALNMYAQVSCAHHASKFLRVEQWAVR